MPAEERRVGNMTDSHEQAVGLDLTDFIGFGIAYLDSLHAATRTWLAEHVFDRRVPHEADLLMLEGAFLHDFRGPELVTPVHDRDMRCKPGEK